MSGKRENCVRKISCHIHCNLRESNYMYLYDNTTGTVHYLLSPAVGLYAVRGCHMQLGIRHRRIEAAGLSLIHSPQNTACQLSLFGGQLCGG